MFDPPEVLAKVSGGPLSFEWADDQPWISDGARSPIVKKLEAMSVRAALTLTAVSFEWLMHRLREDRPASWNRALVAFWSELLDPGSLDLATLSVEPTGAPKADGPIAESLRNACYCIEAAREFDGAVLSYVETGLKLVDFVMPNTAYRTWRTISYARLATLSGAFTMSKVHGTIAAKAKELGVPDYEAQEQIVANDGLQALWGPVVAREDLLGADPLDDEARDAAVARLQGYVGRARR